MVQQNKPLVVMYHYVRESLDFCPSGIRPLLTMELETQLDWLEDNFKIISPNEFLFEIEHKSYSTNDKPPCMLTFDDGTRDQLEIAVPILQRRGLSAAFFVLTWPCEKQKMPITHGLHWALGLPEDEIWSKIVEFTESKSDGVALLGSPQEAARTYYYESELRGLIKYAVNFAMPPHIAEELLVEIAEAQGVVLDDLVREWFLTSDDIRTLDSLGMEVGMHGSSHRSLNQIGAAGVCQEIVDSSVYLNNLLSNTPTWFACPFGGGQVSGGMELVKKTCRQVGVRAMITTNKGFLESNTSSFEIPRFDCIDLPPRSSNLLIS